jgi:hypothetical protein
MPPTKPPPKTISETCRFVRPRRRYLVMIGGSTVTDYGGIISTIPALQATLA